jgi:sugar lactone lactonase YvrE
VSRRLRTVVDGLGFAASTRWHDGEFWYVDSVASTVEAVDADGRRRTITTVPGVPGGLAFLPDGTPLVVAQRELAIYAIGGDGALRRHADLARYARGAAGDIVVDAVGRAYVGHHGFDFHGRAAPKPASLLRVDSDGTVSEVADALTFPSGLVLTPDGRTLLVAEGFAARLTAFEVEPDGSLGARRDWAQLYGHTPDGICLDDDGAVWLGSSLTGVFLRVQEGGAVLDRIDTADGRWAVACAIGGEDGRTLCCATAATTLIGRPRGDSIAFLEFADLDGGGRTSA